MAFVSLLGGGSMILLGQARDSLVLVAAAVFVVGCLVLGVQTALNCIVVVHYPTFIRATGATWATGVGRIGGLLGPVIGGFMLSAHLDTARILATGAIPATIVTLAAVVMRHAIRTGATPSAMRPTEGAAMSRETAVA
jgi:MFS transporter, AAHS family, 4-hydroxybenzoate transporter